MQHFCIPNFPHSCKQAEVSFSSVFRLATSSLAIYIGNELIWFGADAECESKCAERDRESSPAETSLDSRSL